MDPLIRILSSSHTFHLLVMGLVVFVCVGGRYSVWTAELSIANGQDTKAVINPCRDAALGSQQDNQTEVHILGYGPTEKGVPAIYQKTGSH